MDKKKIGERLGALRRAKGVTQDALKEVLGVESRQTIGQIEKGERSVSAEELVKALDYFGVPLERFANPYLLSPEASFSWRQEGIEEGPLASFQEKAGEWIGAYRELSELAGEPLGLIETKLQLTPRSTFEEATAAGEAMAKRLNLGDKPADRLADVLETDLDILVLTVDTIPGVSGAACTLPELNVAIVDRGDPPARRTFDLAHELFHLLTWEEMPPQWIDGKADGQGRKPFTANQVKRIEQLAENFAAGLLMPSDALDCLGTPSGDLASWVRAAADKLGVSPSALKYRLLNSGRAPEDLKAISDQVLSEGRSRTQTSPPSPFGRRFVNRIARSIELGHISARRAAGLMNTTLDELGRLCDELGVERPDELRLEGELVEAE